MVPLGESSRINTPRSPRSPFIDFVTLPEDTTEDELARPRSPFNIAKIFEIDRPRPENQHFHLYPTQKSDLSPFGGSAQDVTRWLPVEPSQRNAELLYYCRLFSHISLYVQRTQRS